MRPDSRELYIQLRITELTNTSEPQTTAAAHANRSATTVPAAYRCLDFSLSLLIGASSDWAATQEVPRMSGSSSRHVSFPRENDHRPGSAGPHWSIVPNRPIGSSSAPDSGQDEHQRCRRRDRTGSSESEKSSRPEKEQKFGFVALCCICCWFV